MRSGLPSPLIVWIAPRGAEVSVRRSPEPGSAAGRLHHHAARGPRHSRSAAGPVWRTHLHDPVPVVLEPVVREGPLKT